LTILNLFTPLPIHFQLNLNPNTEPVNSLNVFHYILMIIVMVNPTLKIDLEL